MLHSKKLFVIVAISLFAIGCDDGPPRAGVSGNVTFNGQPIEQGKISFIPSGNTEGVAATADIAGGSYSLPPAEGAPIGAVRVEITAHKSFGQREMGPPAPKGTMIDDVRQIIPVKYNVSSTLTTNVAEGDNTANFELKGK